LQHDSLRATVKSTSSTNIRLCAHLILRENLSEMCHIQGLSLMPVM